MWTMLIPLIAVGSAMWVYLDTTNHKIGHHSGKGLSPGNHAWLVLFLWFPCFPLYLWSRKALIEQAQRTPVEPGSRAVGIGILGGLVAIVVVSGVVSYLSGDVPNCGDQEVVALAEQLLKDSPVLKLSGIDIIEISMPGEASYDAMAGKRTCRAMMKSVLGESGFHYSVEWHNKDKGEIWVEVSP